MTTTSTMMAFVDSVLRLDNPSVTKYTHEDAAQTSEKADHGPQVFLDDGHNPVAYYHGGSDTTTPATEIHVDCSAWASYALDAVAPMSFAIADQFKESDQNWARAFVYNDLFAGAFDDRSGASTGGFDTVNDLTDLAAGDILSWAAGTAIADNPTPGEDTGHIMVVTNVEVIGDAAALAASQYATDHDYSDKATQFVAVTVADSSSVPHWNDNAAYRDFDQGAGLGEGTIVLALDDQGRGLQYQFAADKDFDPSAVWDWDSPPADSDLTNADRRIAAARISDDITIGDDGLTVTKWATTPTTLWDGSANQSYGTHRGDIAGTGTLTKEGHGTLTLDGAVTNDGGIAVKEGDLIVNGTVAQALTSQAGTVIAGTGTLADTTVDGYLLPGHDGGAGTLSTGNLTLQDDAILKVDTGITHDQVVVSGVLKIENASLELTHDGNSAAGNSFTIIDNNGSDPVQGHFKGIQEGAVFQGDDGHYWSISYQGNDGNDVVITRHDSSDIDLVMG